MNAQNKNTSTTSSRLLCSTLAAAMAVLACACADVDGEGDGIDGAPNTLAAAIEVSRTTDLSAPRIGNVTAAGPGCPKGSFSVKLVGDEAQVTFTSLETKLAKGKPLVVNDCTLSFQFAGSAGHQVALASYAVPSYVILDQGATATTSLSYRHQGMPTAAEELRTNVSGPFDDAVDFAGSIATPFWSTCGQDRLLQVTLRTQIRATGSAASGYVATPEPASFKVKFRPCATR